MNRNKILSSVFVASMAVGNTLPVLAATNETQTTNENTIKETEVLYEQSASYFVTIPKTITLDGATKSSNYNVKVEGDIPSDKEVYVSPIDGIADTESFDFYMKDPNLNNPKNDVVATITQSKTIWNFEDMANSYEETNNNIVAPNLTAGTWKGTFDFEINMHNVIEEAPHQHTYTETITKEATCTEEGMKKYTCTCDDFYTDVIPKLQHNYENNFCTQCGEQDPSTIKYIDFTVTKENRDMIGYSTEISDLIIPETFKASDGNYYKVVNIDANTFSYCANLNTVNIPDTVITIGKRAFFGCNNLTTITIGKNATNIGDGAFSVTDKLENIFVDIENTSFCDIDGVLYTNSLKTILQYPVAKTDTNYTLPNETISIGYGAFADNINLATVTMSNNVLRTCSRSFEKANSLETVNFSNKINSIGSSTFAKCKKITSMTIPDTVTAIEGAIFYECSSLTEAILPDTVDSFGISIFKYCSNLETVQLPNNLTEIPNYTFAYCSKLTEVNIPTAITKIGKEAFMYCANTPIILPDSVTFIGRKGFYQAYGITSVPNSLTEIEEYAFDENCNLDESSKNKVLSLNSNAIGDFVDSWGTSSTRVNHKYIEQ